MTQEQINEIKEAETWRRAIEDKIRELQNGDLPAARLRHFNLTRSCDHRHPDGTDANENHFLFTMCSICGQDASVV